MLGAPLGYDEQYFVWTGWSVLKGSVPYKDFLEFKPPVLFLTHALALKLCGFAGMKFRWFFLVFVVGSLTAVQLSLLSRRVNRALALALVVGAAYLVSDGRYHDTSFADVESSGYAYYMFAVAALLARTAHRNVTDAVGGACLTLCLFTKEPFLPPVLATWVTAFVAVDGIGDLRSTLPRYVKFTALGAGVVLAGLCLYMVPTGAMTAYVKLVYSYRNLFRDPQKSYCILLGQFHPTGSVLRDLPRQWDVIHGAFFNVPTLGFLAPAFAASFVFLARRYPARARARLAHGRGGSITPSRQATATGNTITSWGKRGSSSFFFLGPTLRPQIGEDRVARCVCGPAPPCWRPWAFLLMSDTARIATTSCSLLRIPEPIPGVVDFVRTHSTPAQAVSSRPARRGST